MILSGGKGLKRGNLPLDIRQRDVLIKEELCILWDKTDCFILYLVKIEEEERKCA